MRPLGVDIECLSPPSLFGCVLLGCCFGNHVSHVVTPHPTAAQGFQRDLRQTVTFAETLDREREG